MGDQRDDQEPGEDAGLSLFDEEQAERTIRKTRHGDRWFYSVIDVIGFLTDSAQPRRYWTDMKRRIADDEGFVEVYANCVQLKLRSADGKMRETDCADTETLLRIVQSVPSPKAEPFKQWLARVGTERLAEMDDPARAVERMRKEYQRLGYADAWIEERLKNIAIRNALTDEWRERGADERRDFAQLTDTLSRGTFDLTTGEHRQVKHLGARANLRDSMTPLELVLTSLAEVTATELHQERDSQGYGDLHRDAHEAGEVGGAARLDIEARLKRPVVSPENATQLRQERQRELQPPLLDAPSPSDPSDTEE
jgi:hypothetical protein